METEGLRDQNDAEAGRDRPAEIIVLSAQLRSGLTIPRGAGIMDRKAKRDRKNALHRKNEKRRGKVKSRKLFGPKNSGQHVRWARGIVMSVEGIMAAVAAKSLSADSIRCLSYVLENRSGRRSDAMASLIGRRLSHGSIEKHEAEYLVANSGEIILSVFDEVEPFEK
jgi:hypothetical protein